MENEKHEHITYEDCLRLLQFGETEITPEEVGDRAPTFSFLLQVLSQGEDSIFYSIPERIQLSRTTETEEETP